MHLAMKVNAWWASQLETAKPTVKKGTRFTHICKDAESLGVDRIHLWKVLTGRRVSASLLKKYKALKAEQKGASE